MPRNYPAKILLYGEHTVLRGGRGLAVPYPGLSLKWWSQSKPDERLLAFVEYLKATVPQGLLKTDLLKNHLLAGWQLSGNIPTGYGLGSSGAVCAAIWDRFATDEGKALSTEKLRNALASMEQHFHGQSSGTDPLICYLQQPVLLGGGQPPQKTELPENWSEGFFLLDTGIERKAAEFIRSFTSRYDADAGFARAIDEQWTANADAAITALLAGDRKELWECTARLADFQLREFPDFIPGHLHEQWTGKGYQLKLCGAGGGGMMLGLSSDRELVENTFGKTMWL